MDSRLRRFPPDRVSAVPYGQTVDNAMRCPPLAHRSAAAHKLHSAQANRYKIRESQNQNPGTGLSLFQPGGCPNDRDHRRTLNQFHVIFLLIFMSGQSMTEPHNACNRSAKYPYVLCGCRLQAMSSPTRKSTTIPAKTRCMSFSGRCHPPGICRYVYGMRHADSRHAHPRNKLHPL